MERKQLEEIVDRVLTWPDEDQEKMLRFVNELEEWEVVGPREGCGGC
jgi:hypothetical protein